MVGVVARLPALAKRPGRQSQLPRAAGPGVGGGLPKDPNDDPNDPGEPASPSHVVEVGERLFGGWYFPPGEEAAPSNEIRGRLPSRAGGEDAAEPGEEERRSRPPNPWPPLPAWGAEPNRKSGADADSAERPGDDPYLET